VASVSETSSTTASRAGTDGRRNALAVAGVGVAAVVAAVALSPAAVANGPELCPFARMTGLPCPACGLTRSWVALAHGDLAASFTFNASGPLFLIAAIVVTVCAVVEVLTGRPILRRVRLAVANPVGLAVLVVWFGYGIVRAIDAAAGWGVFPSII
jgi:hypothetical protein